MTIVLCGIGNLERGDDSFGPYIIQHLNSMQQIKTMDCGMHIENHLNKIIEHNPDLVILLDAIAGGAEEKVLLKNEEIGAYNALSITTHAIPFSTIFDYLKVHANADVWLLGIAVSSYEHFTEKAKAYADFLIDTFHSLDKQSNLNILQTYETVSSVIGFNGSRRLPK